MTLLYVRPVEAIRLGVQPRLASWDRADHPSQGRLAEFLAHAESIVAPMLADTVGRLAVELIVGLPAGIPLASGGRDLDNYLFPLAQRLRPERISAMFGSKVHGSSSIAIGPAQLDASRGASMFSARMAGSYEKAQWKESLHSRLREQNTLPLRSGREPVAIDIAITTGLGRNWTNLWKPLIDSLGPLLGEDPSKLFHPHDDRIVHLGLHHHIDATIGHDVIINAWWSDYEIGA